jgi:hypothetical protein
MTAEEPPPSGSTPKSEALVVRDPNRPLTDDVKMQDLWLSLQKRSWRTLAVVGASKGIDTLKVANDLAKIAWWYTGQPSAVFDMRDLSLRLLEHQLREMTTDLTGGERVFIALRSTSENPTTAPLARAADSAVLCVQLGKTETKAAQRTLDAVGIERFLGTLLVSAEDGGVVSPPPSGSSDGADDAAGRAKGE